ncbi:MAG: TIGR04255 family protein [Bacteroidales bacterium]|nr:TIGR04255 family protein [Bacteroidales bacterium]
MAELVVGVQFDQSIFDSTVIFDFYQKIKDKFPKIREDNLLPEIIEKTESLNETNTQNSNIKSSRKLFFNSKETKLIQIQHNKLLFNWRKAGGNEEYPHFDNVYAEFKKIYEKLTEKKNQNTINQYEVTYVDHINMKDFGIEAFNTNSILSFNNFDNKEVIKSIFQHFSIPQIDLNGNINLQVQSAIRNDDKSKVLVIESTCRGYSTNVSFDEWYNIAHERLVNQFEKMTTENAQLIWEKEKWIYILRNLILFILREGIVKKKAILS